MTDYQSMTEQEFRNEVMTFAGKYSAQLLEEFINCWTEPIIKGKDKGKMRFQGNKTWRTSGRLATFSNNQKRWYGDSKVRDRVNDLHDYANRHN